jgi:MOSC domain-containing protein YiiM
VRLVTHGVHAYLTQPCQKGSRRTRDSIDSMRVVTLPTSGDRMQRSVSACLASILELDVGEVPVPGEGHPEPWTVWQNWLAQRGLGLVPIADPANFHWPGPWLAMLRAADAEAWVGAVAFGAPPAVAWNPLSGPETFDAVRVGYLIAPADVALSVPLPAAAPRDAGRVEAIAIAPQAEAPMVGVDRATARAGRGLKGDRYFDQRGTFSNAHGRGYDLTLIEAEVLDTLQLPVGRLAPEEARRNVVTRGIELNALVGKPFTIGAVQCLGQRLCEPCAHLERLTAKAGKPGTLRALIHKGGLRADVLSDGEICVGHEITPR